MGSPNIAPPLSGQVIGSVNDAFVIAEWRDPGGPPGPPRLIAPPHLHRTDDEAWYVLAASRHSLRSGWQGGSRGPRGLGSVRATWDAVLVLESGPGARSLFAGHDRQHLSIDSGNPRDERANARRVARSIHKIRF